MLSAQPASSMINKSGKSSLKNLSISLQSSKSCLVTSKVMIASCVTHLGVICDKSQVFARSSRMSLNRVSLMVRNHEIFAILRIVHIFIQFIQISSSCFKLSYITWRKGLFITVRCVCRILSVWVYVSACTYQLCNAFSCYAMNIPIVS